MKLTALAYLWIEALLGAFSLVSPSYAQPEFPTKSNAPPVGVLNVPLIRLEPDSKSTFPIQDPLKPTPPGMNKIGRFQWKEISKNSEPKSQMFNFNSTGADRPSRAKDATLAEKFLTSESTNKYSASNPVIPPSITRLPNQYERHSRAEERYQTVEGAKADNMIAEVIGTSGGNGKEWTTPTAEMRKKQEECDAALTSGKNAFDEFKYGHARRTRLSIVKVEYDSFDSWFKKQKNIDEPTRLFSAKYSNSMQKCYTTKAPDDFPPVLAKRLGALIIPEGKRQCSGMQLSTDTILTAAHCLQRNNKKRNVRSANSIELTAYKFELSGGAQFAVKSVESGGATQNLEDQWIILKTAPMPAPEGILPLSTNAAEIKTGDEMLIAGLISVIDQEKFSPRYSQGYSCRALYATSGCLIHTCNSVPGLSGAPLFVKHSNQWRFAGVHVRTTDESDYSETQCQHPAQAKVKYVSANGGSYVPQPLR